ncbi:RNA polymerase sigma factor [Frigoriglobus tundricola]|uniref:RNA polymerase sigma-70 ECF-like HTH domain-containing protein n=1 Tax=Frigoriglobus tundricola TaxID=2774151 RepID=A0A6M5Z4F4_9BACT|nr:RNA polymerase sigma factor [Frigoriglobus tundricola]QJX01298.1 hypothetical protein FTUN_8940 [Frigoriglobus tundricola]
MTVPPLDDLLEKLRLGDAHAAEQVFTTYEPYLRKVVRRQLTARLRTRFDSLDIVQSAWRDLLHGFRHAGWRFTTVNHLTAFLVRATRNRFIDRYRQHRAAIERETPLTWEAQAELARPGAPSPGDLVGAEDLWQRMLDLCPPEHRELLRLRREGVALPDLAARFGLHVGSVRRILRSLALRLACDSLPPDVHQQ